MTATLARENEEAISQHLLPRVVVDRLPLYARTLSRLAQEGRKSVSSSQLAELLAVHPEQVRRDFSYMGHLGRRGLGYNVPLLEAELRRVLGADNRWRTVLIGGGDLGTAILRGHRYTDQAFPIEAVFGARAATTALSVPSLPLRALPAFLREHPIDVAILAVTPARAQSITDVLVRSGVRAILNCVPVVLRVPRGVLVRSLDPLAQLQEMAYYLYHGVSDMEELPPRAGGRTEGSKHDQPVRARPQRRPRRQVSHQLHRR